MRVLYFGSGAFGLPTLAALADEHELVGVVTQPDKPAGRKKVLTPTPVAQWMAENRAGVPVHKPAKVRAPEVVGALHGYEADAWVVIAYGQLLPDRLLRLNEFAGDGPAIFAINLHGSILPRHRGASPIHATILAGDEFAGSSVIRVVSEMDAGNILAQSRAELDPMTTTGELHDELAEDGPDLVLEVLERFGAGTLWETEQDASEVTHAAKMTKADGVIDWLGGAVEIRRRIHAFNPWPGAATGFGGEVLKLHRAEALGARSDEVPGTLVDPGAGLVATGDGLVRLIEVQPPGKKAMGWADFARGRTVERGVRLGIEA